MRQKSQETEALRLCLKEEEEEMVLKGMFLS